MSINEEDEQKDFLHNSYPHSENMDISEFNAGIDYEESIKSKVVNDLKAKSMKKILDNSSSCCGSSFI